MLKMQNIELVYCSGKKQVKALDNISVDVEKGEFLSIVGPSGCGKTTILKIIARLINPTKGKIIKPDDFEVGYVFQNSTLLKWRSIIDNIALPLEIKGIEKQEAYSKAEEAMNIVELEEFRDAYPKDLSGGMRHRAAIARALVYDPEILLMDEPFGALDEPTRLKLNVEINRIWIKTHRTVIFVTHNVGEAVFLSNRVAVLSKRPAHIKKIIKIDLPKQRTLEILDSEKYIKQVLKIRKIFSQ
ncbi:MAG: ABC transporter ATP-binding protein [Candidatus Nanohalarchaeota archaeon]|nr:MAG: ABC transporter ATP-binding protein [Candidatus Nanohaloarchaeota archaeon]